MEDLKVITQNRQTRASSSISAISPVLARRSSQALKRSFDIVVSALLLTFLAPAILVLWRMTSREGGKGIYGQQRVGKGGKLFTCYKLRTMVTDADERLQLLLATSEQARLDWEDDFRLEQDPRVTEFGQFLRSTSLDKLPQLWNVLRGDMSLVGPRPIKAVELERYASKAGYYTLTKPGITGLWQVCGRRGNDYATRAHYDAQYASSWKFWSDSMILCKTAGELIRGKDVQ